MFNIINNNGVIVYFIKYYYEVVGPYFTYANI